MELPQNKSVNILLCLQGSSGVPGDEVVTGEAHVGGVETGEGHAVAGSSEDVVVLPATSSSHGGTRLLLGEIATGATTILPTILTTILTTIAVGVIVMIRVAGPVVMTITMRIAGVKMGTITETLKVMLIPATAVGPRKMPTPGA